MSKKKRKNMNKIESMRIHTKRAVMDRYGIDFSKYLRNQAIAKITNGQSIYMGKQSGTRALHFIDLDLDEGSKQRVLFVYDKTRHEFRTALHLTALEEGTMETLE